MARKAIHHNGNSVSDGAALYLDAPISDLSDHIFYGLSLDEEQKEFRDSIWSDDYDIIFVNAKSGSGKTLLAVATSVLMCECGKYNGIIYLSAAGVHEYKQGYLPGTLEEKSKYLHEPLRQALIRIGYNPDRVIYSDSNISAQKNGSAFITAMTDSFVRGVNIGSVDSRVILIVDEAQNYTKGGLQTVLTRINEGSKAVIIGHDGQCDLKYTQDSGFVRYLEHFRPKDRCKICTLTKNYRGWVSAWADELR